MKRILIFFLIILFAVSCNKSNSSIEGTWKLNRIYVQYSGVEHSLSDFLRQGNVKRTMTFKDSMCTDVEYRDGTLYDSIHVKYRITENKETLFIYRVGEMMQFWEISELKSDSMKLVAPNNLVYVFSKY